MTCETCGSVDTRSPCSICADNRRDAAQLVIVETVGDLWALERAGVVKGRYHVLGGTLSPLDGVGPPTSISRASSHASAEGGVREVIIAVNATVDGQTTAHYVTDMLSHLGVRVTRLAHGVPVGGELDYLDEGTLAAAIRLGRSGRSDPAAARRPVRGREGRRAVSRRCPADRLLPGLTRGGRRTRAGRSPSGQASRDAEAWTGTGSLLLGAAELDAPMAWPALRISKEASSLALPSKCSSISLPSLKCWRNLRASRRRLSITLSTGRFPIPRRAPAVPSNSTSALLFSPLVRSHLA